MNLIHRVYCRSRIWRAHVRALLPWALDGISLERSAVLELGPGPGLTTDWLVPRVASLTCVEYDEADASALARRHPGVVVRRGDATALPFESGSFDAVVCFTMLHHLPSAAAQERLCAQARVVRSNGLLLRARTAAGVPSSRWHTSATPAPWSIRKHYRHGWKLAASVTSRPTPDGTRSGSGRMSTDDDWRPCGSTA